MKKIIVIRHAHKNGDELTQQGIEHSRLVAENIATIHLIITSERNRTMQTAKLLSGAETRIDARANPPIWSDHLVQQIKDSQKTHKLGVVAAIWEHKENLDSARAAGEKLFELVTDLFKEINDNETGLIVSHDGTMVAFEKLITKQDFEIMPDQSFQELSGIVVNEDLKIEAFNSCA